MEAEKEALLESCTAKAASAVVLLDQTVGSMGVMVRAPTVVAVLVAGREKEAPESVVLDLAMGYWDSNERIQSR